MFKGLKEIWKNFVGHTKSSRFCIIIIVIGISFVSAVLKVIFSAFPFVIFVSVLNGLGLSGWVLKTFEPGAKERRINNKEK